MKLNTTDVRVLLSLSSSYPLDMKQIGKRRGLEVGSVSYSLRKLRKLELATELTGKVKGQRWKLTSKGLTEQKKLRDKQ